MPSDVWLREKFMKYYFAKVFRISPKEYDEMDVEDVDMLFMINNLVTEYENKEANIAQQVARSKNHG